MLILDNNVNTDLIRDHVDSFIMRFLSQGDSYGYDVHKAISNATEGVYEIKQPTLYSCLKRLEKQGYITSYDGETSNGAQRKYYSLTDKGRDFLDKDIEQWEFSRTLLNRLLSDKEFDLSNAPKPFDPSELRPRTKRGGGLSNLPEESAENSEEISSEQVLPEGSDPEPEAPSPEESPANYGDVPADSEPQDTSDAVEETEEKKPVDIFGSKIYGEQLDLDSIAAEQAPEEEPEPILQDFLADRVGYGDDYRSQLNDIFALSGSLAERPQENAEDSDKSASHNAFNYGELKEYAQANGYKLRPYSKATSSSYYSMNFVFSSRLVRDCLVLLYAFMVLEVLISYFALDRFACLGYAFYLVAACVLLVFPIVGVVLYLLKPDKRVRADFDLKISLSGTLMLALNVFVICMLLAFFVFKADIGKPSTMVKPLLYPALLLINLPIYSILYAVLYHTRKYHLK